MCNSYGKVAKVSAKPMNRVWGQEVEGDAAENIQAINRVCRLVGGGAMKIFRHLTESAARWWEVL